MPIRYGRQDGSDLEGVPLMAITLRTVVEVEMKSVIGTKVTTAPAKVSFKGHKAVS